MADITWSTQAKDDYWQNIDYLLENWSYREVSNFMKAVDTYLAIICKSPKTFQNTNYRNIQFVVIVPQITLFYHIADRNTVELVRFWNNYQDPKKLNL